MEIIFALATNVEYQHTWARWFSFVSIYLPFFFIATLSSLCPHEHELSQLDYTKHAFNYRFPICFHYQFMRRTKSERVSRFCYILMCVSLNLNGHQFFSFFNYKCHVHGYSNYIVIWCGKQRIHFSTHFNWFGKMI